MANNHSKNWTLRINFSTTYTVADKKDYTEMAATTYNYLLSTSTLKYIFKTTCFVVKKWY